MAKNVELQISRVKLEKFTSEACENVEACRRK